MTGSADAIRSGVQNASASRADQPSAARAVPEPSAPATGSGPPSSISAAVATATVNVRRIRGAPIVFVADVTCQKAPDRLPRACLSGQAGLAGSGTHARRVVVGRQRSALAPSSALRSHAPDPAP
ncbi:hypothetical protein GCM10020254_12390 [Streptomyces goshikiensis]